jgi:hypothetical protein
MRCPLWDEEQQPRSTVLLFDEGSCLSHVDPTDAMDEREDSRRRAEDARLLWCRRQDLPRFPGGRWPQGGSQWSRSAQRASGADTLACRANGEIGGRLRLLDARIARAKTAAAAHRGETPARVKERRRRLVFGTRLRLARD